MIDLDRELEICSKATPGPWRKCGGVSPKQMAISSPRGYIVYEMADAAFHREHGKIIDAPSAEDQAANARFMAAARENYPEALREIVQLRAALAEAEARAVAAEGSGAGMIASERQRQVKSEGWTPENDDHHSKGQLAMAAVCYATLDHSREYVAFDRPLIGFRYETVKIPKRWPWSDCFWKPGDRVRELVKAGALIAAEIDRLQRLSARASADGGGT